MRVGERVAAAELPATRAAMRRLRRRLGALVEVVLVVLALALTGWLTINVWHTGDYDVFEYRQYAQAFWLGQPRFTAFPTEYPPLALLPFSLTLLPGFADPRVSFALGLGALFMAGYAGVWRFVGRGAARRYAVYLVLALQSTLLDRYDLVPALAVLAALLAVRRRHFTLAYAMVAVGALLKLYPLVLLPILMIEQLRATKTAPSVPLVEASAEQASLHTAPIALASFMSGMVQPGADLPARLRGAWARVRPALAGVATCAAILAAGFLLPLLSNPTGALSFLRYATNRPIQVESFPATLLWLGTFVGIPLTHSYSFGSDAYTSPFGDAVSMALTLGMVVGWLAVYIWQLRGRIGFERACVACIGLLLLGSKVFSTQYVTWVLPLAAVAGGDMLLWLAVAALTFVDYPGIYPFNQPAYTASDVQLFMTDMALRNFLLFVATVRVLRGKLSIQGAWLGDRRSRLGEPSLVPTHPIHAD
jgi:hypothetical protein